MSKDIGFRSGKRTPVNLPKASHQFLSFITTLLTSANFKFMQFVTFSIGVYSGYQTQRFTQGKSKRTHINFFI